MTEPNEQTNDHQSDPADLSEQIEELRHDVRARSGQSGTVMLAAFIAVLLSVVALIAVTLKLDDNNSATVAGMHNGTMMGAVAAQPAAGTISIVHMQQGCHAWMLNGSTSPTETMQLAAGGTLTVTNNDVMPHKLMLASGSSASLANPDMNHMGATSKVTFAKPGTYILTTKAGEDYTSGVVTTGPDNQLKLQVVVS